MAQMPGSNEKRPMSKRLMTLEQITLPADDIRHFVIGAKYQLIT